MKPTEILINEHGLIRQALDSLSLALQKLEEGNRPPREFFDKAVEFSQTFVDQLHHFKEELLMFTRLAQKKHGELDAQIEALRNQHERGRELVREIARSLDGYARGQEAQITILLENLSAYISLLRRHIHREDHLFYPLADQELSAEEQQSLVTDFHQDEEKKGGAEAFERCRQLVLEMGQLL